MYGFTEGEDISEYDMTTFIPYISLFDGLIIDYLFSVEGPIL